MIYKPNAFPDRATRGVLATLYLQLWGLLAEVSESVSQCLLCLHHVLKMIDEFSGESEDGFILALGLS